MEPDALEQEVNQAYLTDLVRKALDRPGLQVTDWKAQALHGGVEWDSAVFRVTGQANDGNESLPWSLVLKVIRPSEKANDPQGIWYWKREVLAYQSGLLHNLPGGDVTAPACHGVEERPDGSIWLWMEAVQDDVPCPWSMEQYAMAARRLGRFNGSYLSGQPFPDQPWVTRHWLRMYTEHAEAGIDFARSNPDHPVVQHMFPGITLAQILAAWDEHEFILKKLEALPQVFCHQDAFRRNLFARGGKTIAIDWSYLGIAPLGTELVALVAASLGFREIPAEKVLELDRQCFEGYLQGLREAGWQGDPKLVRKGYALGLMMRYPIGGQVGEMLPAFLEQARRARVASAFENTTADEIEKADPAILAYYEKVLPETLKMMGMVGMLRMVGRIGLHALILKIRRKK
jgi:hypothetical protein